MADVELDEAALHHDDPSAAGDRAGRTVAGVLLAMVACVTAVVAVASAGSGYPMPPPVPGVAGTFGSAVAPPAREVAAVGGLETLEDHGGSVLEPGRYVASVAGGEDHPLLPVLSVPDGFSDFGGYGVLAGQAALEGRIVWVWDIAGVYTHPCDPGKVAEIVGPSVADLADALAAQPLRDGTEPVPVTIGGHRGLFVQLSVPDRIDVTECADGRFDSWSEDGSADPARWQQGPGQVDMVWILDVDGDRLAIAAAHGPGATGEEVEELRRIATTTRFVPADLTRPGGVSPSVPGPSSAASSPRTPTTAPVETTGWTTYVSERYGFAIGYPPDWTVVPSDHDWTMEADGVDFTSGGHEAFLSPAEDVRVSAWSVPTPTPESSEGVMAWVDEYCQGPSSSCADLEDRAVPLCNERRDCHPGVLVPFEGDVQAFFTGGSHQGRMVVVAVWRPESHPSVADHGGSRALLQAFLSTMGVCPAPPDPGASLCY
jgi:hypothetical protein